MGQRSRNLYVQAALKVYTRADLNRLVEMWIPHKGTKTKTRYSKRAQAMRLAWAMLPYGLYVEQVPGNQQPDPGKTQPEGSPDP